MCNKTIVYYKKEFEDDFEEIYNYILTNSPQNAIKFSENLKKKIDWIIKNPEAGTIELSIKSKKNWYRFKKLMKSWKIIYKSTKNSLIFLRIIHAKRNFKNINF